MRQIAERLKKDRRAPVGANVFFVQVNSWEDSGIKGFVSGPSLPDPVPFSSLPRLILMLDSRMDLDPALLPCKPPSTTFRPTLQLDILFRQNYSWQGRLRWLAGGQEATFRSVLELMLLIESIPS